MSETENWTENKPISSFVKFNKQGDYIKGVLVSVEEPTVEDQYGKLTKKYVVKAREGVWHDAEHATIKAVEGKIYKVPSKPSIDAQLDNPKEGQKIMFQYKGPKKSSKGQPMKEIAVLQPRDAEGRIVMDIDFLNGTSASQPDSHEDVDAIVDDINNQLGN